MRAFVTGGTGFVGSHLVEVLLEAGHEVVALVRNPEKAARVFRARTPEIVRGDLDDAHAIAEGVAGADVVFHVAGAVAARSRAEFLHVNAEGTRTVARAATSAPTLKRFVLVSSLAAAGPTSPGEPHRNPAVESAPVTEYGRSKLAGEEALKAYDLPWVIVRPPAVYGPRDVEMFKVFRLASLGLAPVFGRGAQRISLVYVGDLARGLAAAAAAPVGSMYYAAHPEVLTQRQLVARVHQAVRPGRAGPVVLPVPAPIARAALWVTGTAARLSGTATVLSPDKADEFLAEAWTCSPDALIADTGWRPTVDHATGVELTAAWYRQEGWL